MSKSIFWRTKIVSCVFICIYFFFNFRVDEDENKAYRSLKILQPTLAMAGNYRCKVSTFEDEGYVEQTLSIYGK